MARVRIHTDSKHSAPNRPRTPAAPLGANRQFLARVTTQITAASFNTTTDVLTLGTGSVTELTRNSSGDLEDVDNSITYTVYNVTDSASADPSTHYVVVWVIQNELDGEFYYFEPCESFSLT